jgi:hypothetical protein
MKASALQQSTRRHPSKASAVETKPSASIEDVDSNRNEYQKVFLGSKALPGRKADKC